MMPMHRKFNDDTFARFLVIMKHVAISFIMPQSHLDVWRQRVNTVWENRQHVQNWTCAPVNHPPTCSKRLPNASKPTAHRVDTVLATFPKRFHTMCERVSACQTSIQRVLDVYVTYKYRAQRVFRDRSAVFYRTTSVYRTSRPPYRGVNKSPITCFQSVGNNEITNANFYCNTYFWMYVLHSIMA